METGKYSSAYSGAVKKVLNSSPGVFTSYGNLWIFFIIFFVLGIIANHSFPGSKTFLAHVDTITTAGKGKYIKLGMVKGSLPAGLNGWHNRSAMLDVPLLTGTGEENSAKNIKICSAYTDKTNRGYVVVFVDTALHQLPVKQNMYTKLTVEYGRVKGWELLFLRRNQ